jgi:hypothetical protein
MRKGKDPDLNSRGSKKCGPGSPKLERKKFTRGYHLWVRMLELTFEK